MQITDVVINLLTKLLLIIYKKNTYKESMKKQEVNKSKKKILSFFILRK